MSHFDTIIALLQDVLAWIGAATVVAIICFAFDAIKQDITNRRNTKQALTNLKERWKDVALEHH